MLSGLTSGRLSRKRALRAAQGNLPTGPGSGCGACDADDDPCSDEEVVKNEAEQKRTLQMQRFLEMSQVPAPSLQPSSVQVASLAGTTHRSTPSISQTEEWIAIRRERIYNRDFFARHLHATQFAVVTLQTE